MALATTRMNERKANLLEAAAHLLEAAAHLCMVPGTQDEEVNRILSEATGLLNYAATK